MDGFVCSMIGAREHYAVPRALQRIGSLNRLYTDTWAGPLLRRARLGTTALRSLAARCHPDLPKAKVVAFTGAFIRQRVARILRRDIPRTREEQFLRYAAEGRDFALRVNRHLEHVWEHDRPAGLLGYDTGCLETQQWLAARGVPSVVDQVDPARYEEEIVHAEAEKWPGWEVLPGRIPDSYFRRLEEEWRLAARVIVNSDWARDALIRQGVPAEKLLVVPLCYEAPTDLRPHREVGAAPTATILWLGHVILRKGIQYLIEAAKLLMRRPVRFVVAGAIGISKAAVASAPENVAFVGPVSRDQVADLYRTADLFVLPTLSDGFAITQLEAMAHGLPVVTTPNCGRVVTDDEDGRVVPAGDSAALASAIDELTADRAKLRGLSHQAVRKAGSFTLDRVANRLAEVLHDVAKGESR